MRWRGEGQELMGFANHFSDIGRRAHKADLPENTDAITSTACLRQVAIIV
jgi:hypothetical protein